MKHRFLLVDDNLNHVAVVNKEVGRIPEILVLGDRYFLGTQTYVYHEVMPERVDPDDLKTEACLPDVLEEFMALVGPSGSVFIKVREFFEKEGGVTEDWGKSWFAVKGTSIEDARRRVCQTTPGARPFDQQTHDEPRRRARAKP